MRRRLEGFLSQLAAVISNEAESELTDLRAVLAEIEKTLPTMDAVSKRAALVLHRVFSRLALGADTGTEEPANVRQFADLLEGPSVEAMVQHLLLGTVPEWALEDHQVVHDDFLRDQGKRKCLKLPRLFRSYLSLALAERYRQAGDFEQARDLIDVAVENDPGPRRDSSARDRLRPGCADPMERPPSCSGGLDRLRLICPDDACVAALLQQSQAGLRRLGRSGSILAPSR